MSESKNGTWNTWRWVVGILITIMIVTMGIIHENIRSDNTQLQTRISKLEENKVDKEIYFRDINEIKTGVRDITWYIKGGNKNEQTTNPLR